MALIGIELESVFSKNKCTIKKEDYHHGKFGDDLWKLERDGSLNTEGTSLTNPECGEFISKPFFNVDHLEKGLTQLKGYFGNRPLDQCLEFNKSCGCHMHFSIPSNITNKAHYDHYLMMRKYFFRKLKESTVIPDETKKLIKQQYDRSYAKKLDRKLWMDKSIRQCEFNFGSEKKGAGLEWRSMNTRGVRTWTELEEILKIGFKSVEYFLRMIEKYEIVQELVFLDEVKELSVEIKQKVKLEL